MNAEYVWFSSSRSRWGKGGVDHAFEVNPDYPVVFQSADGPRPVPLCGHRYDISAPATGRQCGICVAAVARAQSPTVRCYLCRTDKPRTEFGPAGMRIHRCRACLYRKQIATVARRRERQRLERAAAAAATPSISGAPPSINTTQPTPTTRAGVSDAPVEAPTEAPEGSMVATFAALAEAV